MIRLDLLKTIFLYKEVMFDVFDIYVGVCFTV